MGKGKIAYILKGFPRLSETFIVNEIRLLTDNGLQLGLFSIKGGDALAAAVGLPPVQYLPQVSSLSNTNLLTWLRQNFPAFSPEQVYWLKRAPVRYFKTMGFALDCAVRYRFGSKTLLKKTFIKEFLLATYIAKLIDSDSGFLHLHAHFCHDATTVAWMVSKLTGLPFSFTAHAKDIYQQRLNPGDLLERKLAATRFAVTCTKTNVAYLKARTQRQDKIHGIYHGLDTRLFVPISKPERSQIGEKKPRRLVSVGRLVEKKGFVYLVEACQILRDRQIDFHLDIIGEKGDQYGVIKNAIARYQLDDEVKLLPPVPQRELTKYYNDATAFVLPCVVLADGDRDGIPNVMAEAMASGLAVIVTGVSGIPEIVEHEVNGLIVPDRDAGALANAIARVLTAPELCERLGRAARERIEKVFDAEITHMQLISLFRDVLEKADHAA